MRRSFAAWATGIALGLACAAFGQVQTSVREWRESAFKKFALGEFEAAIPDLKMLIETLKDVKTSQGLAELEILQYNLGIAYFLTGQFTQAEATFQTYCKKYPNAARVAAAHVYVGDSLRFAGKHAEAVKAYRAALAKFRYVPDIRTDIHAGIARCHLAMDEWDAAREPLYQAFLCAPDALRRNRAVTLLVTAFLKTRDLDSLYPLFPYLLRRDSQASRSIAFNLSALEAGDDLFADERYREALWIYRLVFPYEEVQLRTEAHLEHLKRLSEYEKRHMLDPRRLIRLMEWIGDAEAELKPATTIYT